jgi:hypothetical protein
MNGMLHTGEDRQIKKHPHPHHNPVLTLAGFPMKIIQNETMWRHVAPIRTAAIPAAASAGAVAAASMSDIPGTVICPAVPREGRLAAGDHPLVQFSLFSSFRGEPDRFISDSTEQKNDD